MKHIAFFIAVNRGRRIRPFVRPVSFNGGKVPSNW